MTDRTVRPTPRAAAVMPLAVFAVGLLLWAGGAFVMISDRDHYPPAVKLALLTVAAAIQFGSYRRPAAAFAAMAALLTVDAGFGPSLPLWIAMSEVIYNAVVAGTERTRRLVTWACAVVTIGVGIVAAALFAPRAGIMVGLIAAALLLSPIGYARAVVAARRASAAEAHSADAVRAAAISEERRRVARELHDTVAGHVAAIAVLSEAVAVAPDPAPAVASIRANSLAALAEMRRMIDLLATDGDQVVTARWPSLAPLITAARAAGAEVTVRGVPDGLPADVEAVLTRIAGEALANATRHAPGRPVTVELRREPDAARVRVVNPLPDSVAEARPGNGTANMAVRAQTLGGTVRVGPVDDWWQVTATIPVPS